MENYSVPERREWGPWATAGFGVVIGVVSFGAQVVSVIVTLAVVFASSPELVQEDFFLDLYSVLGLCTSVATIASAVVGGGILLILIIARKGISIKDYLALKKIPLKTTFISLSIVAAVIIVGDIANYALGQKLNADFMVDIYYTSMSPVLLWIAIVIVAPIYEEAFFRGFMYTGFVNTRIGVAGTVILTSFVWTALHSVQYGIYQLITLFFIGLILGFARHRTGSLWVPIIMHSFMNAVAMVELAININSLVV
jgi:membrane protease YdiL (CAAX protease family)